MPASKDCMNFRPLGGFYDMIWMFRAISQVFRFVTQP